MKYILFVCITLRITLRRIILPCILYACMYCIILCQSNSVELQINSFIIVINIIIIIINRQRCCHLGWRTQWRTALNSSIVYVHRNEARPFHLYIDSHYQQLSATHSNVSTTRAWPGVPPHNNPSSASDPPLPSSLQIVLLQCTGKMISPCIETMCNHARNSQQHWCIVGLPCDNGVSMSAASDWLSSGQGWITS